MIRRLLPALSACFLLVSLAGCSTVITLASPPEFFEEPGPRQLGAPVGADRELVVSEAGYHVFRTPHCPVEERVRKVRRKRQRGILLAVLEVPLYGLGVADWILAYTIAETSREEKWLPPCPTGDVVPCGERVPAAGERVVLQFSDTGDQVVTRTDMEGGFDPESVLGRSDGTRHVNVYARDGTGFHYLDSGVW